MTFKGIGRGRTGHRKRYRQDLWSEQYIRTEELSV